MRRKSEAIEFDLEHVPGKSEPFLWVPDQILGVYGEVVTKGANRHWEGSGKRMERTLDVHEIAREPGPTKRRIAVSHFHSPSG